MNKAISTIQWAQLLVLTGAHFVVDMFAIVLPVILPAVRSEFGLTLFWGGFVLVAMNLACNAVQMVVGHMRADSTKPLFLHIGLILAVSICFLAVLPRSTFALPMMILLAVVSGLGIAITHPEGLRAVHTLDRIPAAMSTAVFMAGGFIGFATGGWAAAALVSRFGLRGLYALVLCPVIAVVLVVFFRIRLAVETDPANPNGTAPARRRLPFWLLMVMSVPAAVSTTTLVSLLPTLLNELGFELTFGGFSTMIYGIGGALGSFIWAAVAHKKGELNCAIISTFLGIAFLVLYLVLISSRMAVWLLFGAGFCTIAAYILMVTLARSATGPNLGRRMGFIVGGTWALSNVGFMALVPVAESFGTHVVLRFTPAGYLLSGAVGLYIVFKKR